MASRLQDEIQQTKPFGSAAEEAVLQVARTAAVLDHRFEQAIRSYGVTGTQYNVLRILRGAGKAGLCRHAIGSRLVTRVPDVSRLLDRMVAAGLLTRNRDAQDRRMVKAVITAEGLRILQELEEPLQMFMREQLGHMSEEDLRTLNGLLELLRFPPCAGH